MWCNTAVSHVIYVIVHVIGLCTFPDGELGQECRVEAWESHQSQSTHASHVGKGRQGQQL